MNKLSITLIAVSVGFTATANAQSFIGNLTPAPGDSGVFVFWNFNSGSDAISGEFSALTLNPAFGSGTLSLDGLGDPTEVAVFAGSVTNLPSPAPDGTGRGVALAIRNGENGVNNSGSITFTLSMTNLQDLGLSFAGQRTNTGFDSLVVDYSVDGGSSWSDGISIPTLESSMGTSTANADAIRTVDFSTSTVLNDASNVQIRFTFDGGSLTSTAGNNRLDNIQFTGTVIPEPSTYAALIGALALAFVAVRRRRRQ